MLVDAVALVFGRERVYELLRRVDEWRYDKRGKGDLEAIERIHQRYGDDVPPMTDRERRKLDDTVAAYHAVAFDHSAIAVSSLHLYGEDEIPWVSRRARFITDRLPEARARAIPDAGHVSMVDSPERLVAALRGFLNDTLA